MIFSTEYIMKHWEQDWDETKYFTFTPDGDAIGYDTVTETFSFKDYCYTISYDEAISLLFEEVI